MNQNTRNKKNAKYQQNLQKRNGITQKYDYITYSGGLITKNALAKPLKHEFTLTRNKKGNIVSKEIYLFSWSKEAIAAKKELDISKIELKQPKFKSITKRIAKASDFTFTKQKPITHLTLDELKKLNKKLREETKKKKEEKLKELKFNPIRDLLFFSNKKDSLKREAEKAAHETKIKQLLKDRKKQKLLSKIRKDKHLPYKLVIETKTNQEYKVKHVSMKLDQLSELAAKYNKVLSKRLEDYKCIKIIDNATNHINMLFVNPNPEIKQAA